MPISNELIDELLKDCHAAQDLLGALLNKSELVTAELLAYQLLCDPDAVRHS